MRGTAQAWIISPDGDFYGIEHAFLDRSLTRDHVVSNFANGLVHWLVVVGSRDDQIAHGDQVLLIHLIMMKQGASGGLQQANTLAATLTLSYQISFLKISFSSVVSQ